MLQMLGSFLAFPLPCGCDGPYWNLYNGLSCTPTWNHPPHVPGAGRRLVRAYFTGARRSETCAGTPNTGLHRPRMRPCDETAAFPRT